MRSVALRIFLFLPLLAIAESTCQNPYCMFIYLGYQGVTRQFPGISADELFRKQLKQDETVCPSRMGGDSIEVTEWKRQLVHSRYDLMTNLFEFERSFYSSNATLSHNAEEKLRKQLEYLQVAGGGHVPYWAICCIEVSLARLIIESKLCTESVLTSVLPMKRIDCLVDVGMAGRWRIRRFRDLLVCAIRIVAYQRLHGCLPENKSDFTMIGESFAEDIEYCCQGDVWQLKIGDDGDASADFNIYVPDILNPAGVVKTDELRLSSTFHEKRCHVFLQGDLYGENPRWACYINHSRTHSLSWRNLGIGGLWKRRELETGSATQTVLHAGQDAGEQK